MTDRQTDGFAIAYRALSMLSCTKNQLRDQLETAETSPGLGDKIQCNVDNSDNVTASPGNL